MKVGELETAIRKFPRSKIIICVDEQQNVYRIESTLKGQLDAFPTCQILTIHKIR